MFSMIGSIDQKSRLSFSTLSSVEESNYHDFMRKEELGYLISPVVGQPIWKRAVKVILFSLMAPCVFVVGTAVTPCVTLVKSSSHAISEFSNLIQKAIENIGSFSRAESLFYSFSTFAVVVKSIIFILLFIPLIFLKIIFELVFSILIGGAYGVYQLFTAPDKKMVFKNIQEGLPIYSYSTAV